MSITQEITRIQQGRNKIRNKLVELGLATSTDNLDTLVTAVESIEDKGAVSATVQEGETYTIPKGYHSGSGTVSGVSGGGNYALQSKPEITPTKKQQQITPDNGYYGLSDVTIGAIPDAYQDVTAVTAGASDVLTGKTIVNSEGVIVAGTMLNNGSVSKVLTTGDAEYTVPTGYHSGSGKITIVPEDKTATPTKEVQNITASSGKVLNKVSVAAIPNAYQDVTKVDATASDVLTGKTIVTSDGTVVAGSMVNNGVVNGSIDGITQMSFTVPAGYTTGGTINLTSDIEDALSAI